MPLFEMLYFLRFLLVKSLAEPCKWSIEDILENLNILSSSSSEWVSSPLGCRVAFRAADALLTREILRARFEDCFRDRCPPRFRLKIKDGKNAK